MLTSLARASLDGTAGMIEPKKGMFARLRLAASWHQINGPLFRKYVALFLAVVFIVLLINVLFEVAFSYQEQRGSLIRIQREQAEGAATKIGQFIKEIESQVGWTTQLPWSAGTLDQRAGSTDCGCCARYRRLPNLHSSIRPARSNCESRALP